MPDLQNVCQAVKRKVTEERQAKSELFKKKVVPESVHRILYEAYHQYKRSNGYANVAQAGTLIKKALPNFNSRTYGFPKLSDLISNFPDRYELLRVTRDIANNNAPQALYKCR